MDRDDPSAQQQTKELHDLTQIVKEIDIQAGDDTNAKYMTDANGQRIEYDHPPRETRGGN